MDEHYYAYYFMKKGVGQTRMSVLPQHLL